MRIGLIDVDGHHFPNVALMKISEYHKRKGDVVEWYDTFNQYDRVYLSKVFSFSQDYMYPINAKEIIKGGTGYEITTIDGKEYLKKGKDLPKEIEQLNPDYTLYPQFDYAVSMTTRGCPRGCPFCHVPTKEGRYSHKVANVDQYYNGQKHIEILDPNITACQERFDIYEQYIKTNATLCFNQGMDIRLITDKDIDYLNEMKIKELHFAWDNPKDDLRNQFELFASKYKRKNRGTVYVLTNYNSTMEENLYRINTLWSMGYYPYVMIYDKKNAPREIKQLQRWCNNRFIFKSCRWEDYGKKILLA